MCYHNDIIYYKEGLHVKIENLKIFLEVAQSESINEAARNLFMTHQNLNKIIKNLEAELNTQLFIRTNRGIQLTANGKELFVTASQMIKNYESFLDRLQNTENSIVKFYTVPSQSTLVTQLQGKRFGERYLSVHKRDFEELLKMIQRGKAVSVQNERTFDKPVSVCTCQK